jgi:hypothetical protein
MRVSVDKSMRIAFFDPLPRQTGTTFFFVLVLFESVFGEVLVQAGVGSIYLGR